MFEILEHLSYFGNSNQEELKGNAEKQEDEIVLVIKWASMRENLSSGCANSKGADQPAHPRRLFSAFAICFLESILSKLAEETGLSLRCFIGNSEELFCRVEAQIL